LILKVKKFSARMGVSLNQQ